MLQVLACQVLLLGLIVGLWEWATHGAQVNAFLFGSPSAIAVQLGAMFRDGSVWTDARVTGLETLGGFLLGNLLGTVLGLSLWFSRFVSRVVQPFVIAVGSVPIVALAPIAIIWFGTGFSSKLAMATLSVVVVALVVAYKGALGVDPDQVNLMRSLGATKWQIFRLLVLPASLTDIFAGLKLTVGVRVGGRDRRRVHVLVGGPRSRHLQGRQPVCDLESVRGARGHRGAGADPIGAGEPHRAASVALAA